MKEFFKISEVANILSVSKATLRRWDSKGKLISRRHPINNYRIYHRNDLKKLENFGFIFESHKETNVALVKPLKIYTSIELFAGAGGLALGLEKSGLHCVLLNEIDKWACKTLKSNRPHWNVIEKDIKELDFTSFKGKVDIVTGGFPCQAFSYAGKQLGFEDARGTLFFEFARCVKETKPAICVGENVRGLVQHDGGKTLKGMISVLEDIGYKVLPPQILKAIHHRVPQKRERLLIVGIRKDLDIPFEFPTPQKEIYTLKDALKKGRLYPCPVPSSRGQIYPKRKKEILQLVPPGGYWRDLPVKIQKEYMQGSFYLGGGKTGMARRISWDEPCLTLTCSPAQKQTERCHPDETRPFTVREYARIQTFPDDWQFEGSISQQYKQIGNAVPVHLAEEIGLSLVKALNNFYNPKIFNLFGEEIIQKINNKNYHASL
ncbi:DNA (cytosine-5-)-methyltransferase [Silvanigrella aquatica]|uniref:Cytosine-specific methyltransferase n=1 Tax=Silvanigrella aquatica TaxID=1915309 RepID=A0A1L4D3X6_9BACT|nr:DNA (cytosine-5-)-methyltransferase [Silvanigrella aquatica]APJ04877.1 DNA (cytosine-5-)-methyltransferase [Silvanigrella aquatica]